MSKNTNNLSQILLFQLYIIVAHTSLEYRLSRVCCLNQTIYTTCIFIYNHLHYLITNSHELKIRDCPTLLVYKVCAHSSIISWLCVYMVLLIHSYAFMYYLRMLMYHVVFFYILSGVAMRRKTFVKRHLTEII